MPIQLKAYKGLYAYMYFLLSVCANWSVAILAYRILSVR